MLAGDGSDGWAAVGGAAGPGGIQPASCDLIADSSALQGIGQISRRADSLYDEQSYSDAYALLDAAPRTADTLWRKARVCKELGDAAKASGQKQREKELVLEGFQLAEAALELDDSNFGCHKWYAILTSLVSEFEGTK